MLRRLSRRGRGASRGTPDGSASPAPPSSEERLYLEPYHLSAETLEAHTTAADWSLNTREWREAGFSQADADGAHLRQKQSEVRRMLLAQQRASQE